MSCFVMLPESIWKMAYTLEAIMNAAKFCGTSSITTIAIGPTKCCQAFADCLICDCYEAKLIAAALWDINQAAYAGRYNDPDKYCPLPDKYSRRAHCLVQPVVVVDHQERAQEWQYHLARLLDCWLYQTAEDATYKDKKRLALQEFTRNLKNEIVTHSAEYNSFQWGT